MKACVAVAMHKPAPLPADPLYLPLWVGAAQSEQSGMEGCRRDDSGENISLRNPRWCELTGLYWLWRNVDAEALGLCHYRRYLAGRHGGRGLERVLTQAEAEALLHEYEVLLPKKRHYWVETNRSQYDHAHHASDMDAVHALLAEAEDKRYLEAFDRVMARRSGHRFNLFVMRQDCFRRYCGWLFPLLFQLEQRLDLSGYSAYDQRVFGFVAERLLDVWLTVQRPRCRELPLVYTESQHWPRKILRFLGRWLRGVRRDAAIQ